MGNLQIGYRDAIVARTHWDHIHAAFNRGGIFDRSDFGTAAPADLGLYDAGGVLDHGDLGINLSGKPEAVLTNDQWAALDAAADALRSGGGTTFYSEINATTTSTAEEIAEAQDWELRRLERRHTRGR